MRSFAYVIVCMLLLTAAGAALASDEDIALGRPYVLDTPPNYPLCTEAGDAVQLTDGQHVSGSEIFWIQAGAVGWNGVNPVMFTIDLGKLAPISGVSLNAAARSEAGAEWPNAIYIAISEDQKTWRLAGDLVSLSLQAGRVPPEAKGEVVFLYTTDKLRTRGRWVKFIIVPRGPYAFYDEAEVFKGPDSLLSSEPTGKVIDDVNQLAMSNAVNNAIRARLYADLRTVRAELAALPTAKKSALTTRLDAVEKAIPNLPAVNVATFRTIFPQNSLHEQIMAVHSAVLRARGFAALSAAKANRYDALAPFDSAAGSKPAISIDMMRNEFRADTITLINATDKPMPVRIHVEGLPGGSCPKWLSISAMPWTDTTGGTPVAAALLIAERQNGAYTVTLPVGLQTKLWLSVDSASVAPGTYKGELIVDVAQMTYISLDWAKKLGGRVEPISIPFTLKVSKTKMARPRLSLGVWDYTPDGRFGKNTKAAIDMMKSHFVDSPWATNSVLPIPKEADFDSAGQLLKPLDTKELDNWVAMWPGARRYMVFANVQNWYAFAGAKMGTPEFDARVGSWAKALAKHMTDLKLKPQQLALLLIDEPSFDVLDEQITAWAMAIKSAAPGIALFQDPIWRKPWEAKFQDALTIPDIICPQLSYYLEGGPGAASYYEKLRRGGQNLWFYQCSGPVKTFDPYRYYRWMAWHAFESKAVGMGLWSFFDTGGGKSCWNEYATPGSCFTPVFIDPNGITSGIHWEAVREGIEDYEYLAMLRDAAARSKNAKLKAEALSFLETAPGEVLGKYGGDVRWDTKIDRNKADTYRLKALRLLEKM